MMIDIIQSLEQGLAKCNVDNIFFHTDILRAIRIKIINEQQLLEDHCNILSGFGKEIIMPVFNYDFPKTRVYNLQKDVCQVGAINEYYRREHANWQTHVPVFSCSGSGENPNFTFPGEIDPFGPDYIFAHIHKNPSLIMFYGADLSSTTFLHYVETMSGLLTYRYIKYFEGKIIDEDVEKQITLKLHVRPMGKKLNYDWKRLEQDLIQADIMTCISDKFTRISYMKTDITFNFWMQKLQEDSLYFLDSETRNWVEPMLQDLGRGFILPDFE
jgi:aminoglycoside N3'-acetyltransferase